jgi:hypothetical protein
MLWLLSSNTVKTTTGALAATDSAGVSGVMPLTPESTFVTLVVPRPRRSVR